MVKMKVIAGNCVLESLETTIKTATFLRGEVDKFGFDLIYKSSWTKENRSSLDNFRGLDICECLKIFEELKRLGFTILSDFHDVNNFKNLHTSKLVDVVDILQLPAYLCMQTGLTIAMATTKKPINIKKGQFLHPEDVGHILRKFERYNNYKLSITERGTCFGYRDLVVDPRSFQILKSFNYPVYFDVGHSVRKYGIPSADASGGSKEFINTLAKAAIATGINGIFVEVHPDPPNAKCDATTQLSFNEFNNLIKLILPIWRVVNEDIP